MECLLAACVLDRSLASQKRHICISITHREFLRHLSRVCLRRWFLRKGGTLAVAIGGGVQLWALECGEVSSALGERLQRTLGERLQRTHVVHDPAAS